MFVITGGGTGIGQALALALAQRDQKVMIIGRNEATLKATADQHPYIDYISIDITQTSQRAHLIQHLSAHDHLQALVHNAGTIDPIAPLSTITVDAWRSCLSTNLEAPLFLTQSLLPLLNHGRVLHIGSGAAYFPISAWTAYCVSKAGLSMLTRCWQLEHPSLAISSVMPGIIDTPMQTKIRASHVMDQDKHDFFCRLKASHQLLSPQTVALFLVWLLLDIPREQYKAQEWDIYDNSHHAHWLIPPHTVPQVV